MTILKRGNSKYWYIQFQIDGRTIIKSSRSTSRKAAEQLEAELRSQVHAERYLGQKTSITTEQALRQFVQSKVGTPNHRNLDYQMHTILSMFRPTKPFDQLRTEDLEQFRQKRLANGIKSPTIQHGLNLLRSATKFAKKRGCRVPELSFPTLKLSKGRLRYLSIAEEKRLLEELDPSRQGRGLKSPPLRDKEMTRCLQDCFDLVVLLLDTGARYGEIAGLEWLQVDVDQRVIRLWRPKVQNESVLYMTDRVHEIMHRRKQASTGEFVFCGRDGGPRGYAAQSIKKAFRRSGLSDCTIHTLRHTHATRLIQNGLSLYEVRSVLGHSDIKTTMRYAHLAQADVTSKARDVINKLNAAVGSRS